jgi:ankyrin repeat protein
MRGHWDVAERLIAAGATDVPDREGHRPSDRAFIYKNSDMGRLLRSKPAQGVVGTRKEERIEGPVE